MIITREPATSTKEEVQGLQQQRPAQVKAQEARIKNLMDQVSSKKQMTPTIMRMDITPNNIIEIHMDKNARFFKRISLQTTKACTVKTKQQNVTY